MGEGPMVGTGWEVRAGGGLVRRTGRQDRQDEKMAADPEDSGTGEEARVLACDPPSW